MKSLSFSKISIKNKLAQENEKDKFLLFIYLFDGKGEDILMGEKGISEETVHKHLSSIASSTSRSQQRVLYSSTEVPVLMVIDNQ